MERLRASALKWENWLLSASAHCSLLARGGIVHLLAKDQQQGMKPFSPHQVLLSTTTPPSPKSQTKETQESVQRRMAAMAVANYKRRIQQQQQQTSLTLQESQDQASTNFKQQQSSQSNVSEQGCFSSARPTTNFTGEANPNGTKKWSCDADGVTINTKWFPSSTSR